MPARARPTVDIDHSSSSPAASPSYVKLLGEKIISYFQAASIFPPYRRERPVTYSCVWKWARKGVRLANNQIVRLETIKVAGRHLTTVEAVHRFIAAQQEEPVAALDCSEQSLTRYRTSARCHRGSQEALRQLELRRKGQRRAEIAEPSQTSFERMASQPTIEGGTGS